MFMGRVGETINTLHWFILDVMIEAKKRAWIDLLLEHCHPKALKTLLFLNKIPFNDHCPHPHTS
jgi:hypothetical protein